MLKPTLAEVSIKSRIYDKYLGLDGTGVHHFKPTGDSIAAMQDPEGVWEHIQFEDHADGTFSILSSRFPGCYLRLDPGLLAAQKVFRPNGGDRASIQF